MNDENKKRLDKYVSNKTLEGFIVVDKNLDLGTAVVRKTAKPINHLLHGILTFLTCFWGVVWLILIAKKKTNETIRVSFDESGNLLEEVVKS